MKWHLYHCLCSGIKKEIQNGYKIHLKTPNTINYVNYFNIG